MKRKFLITSGIMTLVIALSVAYFLMQPPPRPPSEALPLPAVSQEQLQTAIKGRVELKAKLHVYKTQLAIYEKILQHAPGNAEAQKRVDTLRHEIEALENQNAPR